MHIADIVDNALDRVPVSTLLEYVARACEGKADRLHGKDPASVAREQIRAYHAAARTIRACARHVRQNANRVGF